MYGITPYVSTARAAAQDSVRGPAIRLEADFACAGPLAGRRKYARRVGSTALPPGVPRPGLVRRLPGCAHVLQTWLHVLHRGLRVLVTALVHHCQPCRLTAGGAELRES